MGVKRKKFRSLSSVICTGRTAAHPFANSMAVVTPANPPPRITMRGASDVERRART